MHLHTPYSSLSIFLVKSICSLFLLFPSWWFSNWDLCSILGTVMMELLMCGYGLVKLWRGRTRDHSLLEMEKSLTCCLGKENIKEENLQKQKERKNWEKADSEWVGRKAEPVEWVPLGVGDLSTEVACVVEEHSDGLTSGVVCRLPRHWNSLFRCFLPWCRGDCWCFLSSVDRAEPTSRATRAQNYLLHGGGHLTLGIIS